MLSPAGGIVQSQDFTIAQFGTPNMSVNVGAGRLWVPGTSLATVNPGGGAYHPQGLYYAENDAAVNLPISASSPSSPRIDTVIGQIQDTAYGDTTDSASLAVVTGTATSGATLANLTGAGAVPASSLVLGYVLVPTSATSIVTADILNVAGAIGQRNVFRGYRNATVAIAAGGWTQVAIDTITFDQDSRLSSGSYLCPTAGLYQVNAQVAIGINNNPQTLQVGVWKNSITGAPLATNGTSGAGTNGFYLGAAVSDIVKAVTGDLLILGAYNPGPNAVSTISSPAQNFLSVSPL